MSFSKVLKNLSDADDNPAFVHTNFGGRERIDIVAASGATLTIDLTDGNVHDVTLTDNCTFTFSNAMSGVSCGFTLLLRQDATGNRTPTWPGSVVWPDGTPPTVTATASSLDVYTFLTTDGGSTWVGFIAGQAFS